jgi:hypothetical protein
MGVGSSKKQKTPVKSCVHDAFKGLVLDRSGEQRQEAGHETSMEIVEGDDGLGAPSAGGCSKNPDGNSW